MRFNTFDSLVSWYEQTKPVVSKNHTRERDVRPIGDRGRKWERIKKIDENTYALLDGNYGNYIWATAPTPVQHEYENMLAPILWMRREDGDFIRIRNHTKNNMTVTRYNFLHYHLPNNLHFGYNQQGKHWVRHNGEELPLPKCDIRIVGGGSSIKEVTDDGVFLMFRVNKDGTFTRVGDKLKVQVNVVDKDLKKQWRDRLDSFYTHCAALAPMLDVTWHGKHEYRTLVDDWLKANDKPVVGWARTTTSLPSWLVREAVEQEDHPMRVAVAAYVIADIGGQREIKDINDVREIKANYNRVMNKAMGFYKIEER
jgi:hypothetical protein